MRHAMLAVALLGEAVCLWLAGRHADFAVAGSALRFVPFMLGAGMCFGVALWAWRWGSWGLWIPCVLFRMLALPMAPGDDLWRYLWEGRVQLTGHNPYVLAPAASELASLRDADWPKVNHPESPAIYPPLAEIVFATLARISATPLFFKIVFALADLATVALLLRLVRGPDRHRTVAIYAWNPAVVYAFAGGGHFDSLMVLALTGAVLLLEGHAPSCPALPGTAWDTTERVPPRAVARGLGSVALLGVAVAFKLVPIFLLPAWALALGRRWGIVGIAVVIPALLTLPFGGPVVVLRPLLAFAEVTRFNDLVWGFVEAATLPNPFGRNWPFTIALLVATAILSWKMRDDWPRAVLWVMGATLLLSPVLHPWYATWILPIAVIRRQHAWTVLSISALCAFLLWDSTAWWQAWEPNLLTRALVAVPPLIAWWAEKTRRTSNPPQRCAV